jgi:hypothetical protein
MKQPNKTPVLSATAEMDALPRRKAKNQKIERGK